MQKYAFEHAVEASMNILVRHPKHSPAARSQVVLASTIVFEFGIGCVRTAVHFDNEPSQRAGKICDVGANSVLSSKTEAIERMFS